LLGHKARILQGRDVKMNKVVTEKFVGIDVSKTTLDVHIDTDKKSMHVDYDECWPCPDRGESAGGRADAGGYGGYGREELEGRQLCAGD
jgi:hypothetical protein